jgi:hypothetical protein
MCSITFLHYHQNNLYIVCKEAGSWWEHTLLYHRLLSSVWHDVLCQAALWFSSLSLFNTLWSHIRVLFVALRYSDSQVNPPWHCWDPCRLIYTCDKVLHRYVQQLFSFTMNLITACSWKNMLLTAISSQWTVGTLKVCMQWTCIYSYIGKVRYYPLLHIVLSCIWLYVISVHDSQ